MTSLQKQGRQSTFHLKPLLICLAVGIAIWLMPHPEALSPAAWRLTAIFIATILGIIIKPLPMGGVSVVALTLLTTTDTLSFEEAFAGFGSRTVWLIVIAFSIARGFITTGLGTRIAYNFVRLLGRRSVGLSYGLLGADLMLAPAIPSVTARSAGVVFPILLGLSKAYGSHPHDASSRRIGSYLTLVAYQGTVVTSAMFLTAMAGNPVVAELAADAGVPISWGLWALAASVPGIVSLLILPLFIYWLHRPEIRQTPNAVEWAGQQLAELGKMGSKEWSMLFVFLLLLVLWMGGGWIGIKATETALIGLCLLMFLGVINWKEVVREHEAWETFVWFATLVMMARKLGSMGVTGWFSEQVVMLVGDWAWVTAFAALTVLYYYTHYFFASSTAHISSMYGSFLAVAIAVGTPPVLAAIALAVVSNLFGGLTHYGTGPAPLLYGAGFVNVREWWRIGFLVSLLHLCVWTLVGGVWWKILQLW